MRRTPNQLDEYDKVWTEKVFNHKIRFMLTKLKKGITK